ncbi:MAG: class I SAM-dependent methyltransferase [Ignavibacteriaceae bacterium]
MEIKEEILREYNPAHPNYKRWQKAREISDDRAKFVEKIISTEIIPEELIILDIGAGEGNTSRLFSQKNFVVSLDTKPERLKKISSTESLQRVTGDGSKLPFKFDSFDIILLQDVIEHLAASEEVVEGFYRLLKPNGIIYLSTPNRLSFFNIIADPHWGLPFLSLFKRNQIKKYFLKIFRKSDYNRNDIAELLSLRKLNRLFSERYSLNIYTKFSAKYLLDGGKGLVWSNFHLGLIKLINSLRMKNILIHVSNDKLGIVNKFVTPTFYLILKKK